MKKSLTVSFAMLLWAAVLLSPVSNALEADMSSSIAYRSEDTQICYVSEIDEVISNTEIDKSVRQTVKERARTGMEHYLGEKLKKLRESRGWTQADLAKRLNKAVSTISGYESDAHAIPLDVLASSSSLFSISTDELLGLDAPEVLSLSGLTGAQKKTLIKLRNELLSPSQKGNDLSPQQMEILHDIIKAFG